MAKKPNKPNPVQKAIDRIGDVRTAATACGVSTQAVYKWLEAGRVVNLKYAFLLADAADMNVKEFAGE